MNVNVTLSYEFHTDPFLSTLPLEAELQLILAITV